MGDSNLELLSCIVEVVTKILTCNKEIKLSDLKNDVGKIRALSHENMSKDILKAYVKIKYPNAELIFIDGVYSMNNNLINTVSESHFFSVSLLIIISFFLINYLFYFNLYFFFRLFYFFSTC